MRTRLFAALAGTLLLCGGCAQTAAPPTVPTVFVTPVPTEGVEPAPTGSITGTDFEAWLFAQDWTVQEQWLGGGGEVGEDQAYVEHLLRQYLNSPDPARDLRNFYITDADLFLIAWDGKYDTHLSVPLADLDLKGGDLWNG